jgi:hypothetical protein
MSISDLALRLSGGAGNTDPAASTGGAKSTLEVLFQLATLASGISGVTMHNAAGNTVGTGTLTYEHTGKTLTWKPPGAAIAGSPVSINANGQYLIRGANPTDGYVIVSVVSASLSNATDFAIQTTIANDIGLFLPAVSKDTALAGATEYYLFYIDNPGATTVKSVSVQIQTDTPGLDTLSISIISAKNTTEILADASGHAYSAIGVELAMGDLLTTDYWGFWIKRVIPAATVDGVINNTFRCLIKALT